MPPFLFVAIGWADSTLKVGEAVERIEWGQGEEVDLSDFIDERMGRGERRTRGSGLEREGPARESVIRLLQLGQDVFRPFDDGGRQPRELRDVDPVAAVRAASNDLA